MYNNGHLSHSLIHRGRFTSHLATSPDWLRGVNTVPAKENPSSVLWTQSLLLSHCHPNNTYTNKQTLSPVWHTILPSLSHTHPSLSAIILWRWTTCILMITWQIRTKLLEKLFIMGCWHLSNKTQLSWCGKQADFSWPRTRFQKTVACQFELSFYC